MSERVANPDWFHRIWEYREQELYPSLFGEKGEGIATILWNRLVAGQIADPRWNTCGVFKFAPTVARQSWLYVTSGLSNAWFDTSPSPQGISGFGCEFVFETKEDSTWPIHRLHQLMAYQIGLGCERYPGSKPLAEFDRVPLGSAIDWRSSALTHIMLSAPKSYPSEFSLESGGASFSASVGVSEDEVVFARSAGGNALLTLLVEHDAFPVTDPKRQTVTVHSG